MNIFEYHAKKDLTSRTTRSQPTPQTQAGNWRSPKDQNTKQNPPITLAAEAQVDDSTKEEETGKPKRFLGWRREVYYAVRYYDAKELGILLKNPNVTYEMVTKEIRKILKAAMGRDTAEGLRRALKFYKALVEPTEDKDKGETKPAIAPFLETSLGSLPKKAQKKLEQLENWHQKLLNQWQEELQVITPKGYIRKEKVVDVYRRHKIHIIMSSTIPIVIFIVNLILFLIFINLLPNLIIINFVLLLIDIGWLAWTINDWSNDYLMITDKRVLQMEKVTYFKLDKKELPIEKAEQIKYESNQGIFDLIFRIGTVTVTGAGYAKLIFDHVYLPDRIRKEIGDAKGAYMGVRAALRSTLMENRLRNKLLGENHEELTEEPMQVDAIARNQQSWWHMIVPRKPILDRDEKGAEQLTFRKHPLFLYRDLVKVVVFLLILILVTIFGLPRLFSLGNATVSLASFIIIIFMFIANIFWLWYVWEDWHNDLYIINNRDIIDMERKPFGFDEEKNVITLLKVQDIQSEQPSLFANLFNYGNVKVTTSGAGKPIVFRHVPDPENVQAEFSRRMIMAKDFVEDQSDKLIFSYILTYNKMLPENKRLGIGLILDEIDALKDKVKRLEEER